MGENPLVVQNRQKMLLKKEKKKDRRQKIYNFKNVFIYFYFFGWIPKFFLWIQ